MERAGPDSTGQSQSGASSPRSQRSYRNYSFGPCPWDSSYHFAYDMKVTQVCRFFQQGFCLYGDQCRYQHLQPPPYPLGWSHYGSEPQLALLEPRLGLARRSSEPIYLPSAAVAWNMAGSWRGTEPSLDPPANKVEEVGGSSWQALFPSAVIRDYSYSQAAPSQSDLAGEIALLQRLNLEEEEEEEEEDSRNVVCGICIEKVWDKPQTEGVFGILPNCPHPYCLGCLRTWRRKRSDFSLDVIKSCPQCRIHSSYIIPSKIWVSKGPKKAQLIQNFKARTSQIRCRFFWRGNGHCPFKSDCIYQHQTSIAGPTWPESVQLPSGSEVLGPAVFLGHPGLEDNVVFTDWSCPWPLGPPLLTLPPGAPPGRQQF